MEKSHWFYLPCDFIVTNPEDSSGQCLDSKGTFSKKKGTKSNIQSSVGVFLNLQQICWERR